MHPKKTLVKEKHERSIRKQTTENQPVKTGANEEQNGGGGKRQRILTKVAQYSGYKPKVTFALLPFIAS